MTGEFSTGGAIASVAGGVGLAGILDYFHVSGEVLVILSVMLLLDYIFGILDAYLLDKYSVTSTQMWRGLVRKLSRRCLPLIVIGVLRGTGAGELETISTIVYSILIITEGYSILGHIYCINTGKNLPEIDGLEWLLSFLANTIKGKLPKEIETKEITEMEEETKKEE